MNEAQEKFIKAAGDKWDKALIAATLHIRSDRHFVGLDKIREPAILAATFQALNADDRLRPSMARLLLDAPPGVSKMIDDLIDEAARVAKAALRNMQ